MRKKYVLFFLMVLVLAFSATLIAQGLSPLEQLGKHLYFDENLSAPMVQSCATCHAPEAGFTGPISQTNLKTAVYPGAVFTRFGNRKPPTAAYGGDSPIMHYDTGEGLFIGGMFWDGRATGEELGDPLAEQARGPFLNPLEQNGPNKKYICLKVAFSDYAELFEAVWGDPPMFKNKEDIEVTYDRIALSIAAFEASTEVNPFNSKFDDFWDNAKAANVDVTAIDETNYTAYYNLGLAEDEVFGLAIFNDETKGACSLCHTLDEGSAGYPLFTDFSYDNLGTPKNPDNPFYTMPRKWNPAGEDWIDPGLGGFLEGHGNPDWSSKAAENYGKHKVPTLRNVDKRPYPGFIKAYGHNGFFKSLEEITHFYNTRDVEPWPEPEVAENVNTDELGDLGLTAAEEAAIVTFMKTLSDGYVPPAAPVISGGAALVVIGPNPFNPGTRFSYILPNAADIRLEVYNIVGQKVATLASGQHAAGEYQVEFNARDLASGIYLVRLQNEQTVMTQKVTLIK